jgi:hypothetical protein
MLHARVAMIPATEAEVQFDEDGAGIQVALAFEVKHLDYTVQKMTATLTHTEGRQQPFEWAEYVENVGHMILPGAGIGTFLRGQRAIAIRLEVGQLTERIIRFQSREFARRLRGLAVDLGRSWGFQGSPDESDRARLVRTNEFRSVADAYERAFLWSAGRYVVQVTATGDDAGVDGAASFAFELTDADVERLRGNLGRLKSGEWIRGVDAGDPQDLPDITVEVLQ